MPQSSHDLAAQPARRRTDARSADRDSPGRASCAAPAITRTSRRRSSRSRTAAERRIHRICTGRTPCTPSTKPSRLGYHYLETDVHPTPDGVLLAFHDAVLDRVSDVTRPDRGLPLGRDRGRPDRRRRSDSHAGRAVRDLSRRRFNIDAKSDRTRSICWPETIAEHDAYDRVCVSSFGVRRLHRLRRLLGPRVSVGGEHVRRRAEPLRPVADPGPQQSRGSPCRSRSTSSIGGRRIRVLTPAPAPGGPSRRQAGPHLDRRRRPDHESADRCRCRRNLHRPDRYVEERAAATRPVDRRIVTDRGREPAAVPAPDSPARTASRRRQVVAPGRCGTGGRRRTTPSSLTFVFAPYLTDVVGDDLPGD